MPPTKGKRRGAGGSGSQSRRRRGPVSRPAPGVTTRSSAAQAEPSPPPAQSGERSRVADKSKDDELKPSKRAKKTNASRQEVADDDGSASINDAAAASDSDQASSPLRRPYLPRSIKSQEKRVVYEPLDSADICAYLDEKAKYQTKLDRQKKLLTLDKSGPITCLDDETFLPDQESMVFQTAKAVLGLTSYIDGKLLAQCSGFLIELDKETGRGTILTSANLLCTKSPKVDDWSCPREYAPDAEVLIHLLDNTTEKGILINYHKHYNIALFEVVVKTSGELALSTELIEYGQDVFLIGRDENLNLNASYGKVERMDGGLFDHFHYMYVDCGVAKFGAGGPSIDTKGRVVGMANPTPRAAFIPSAIILKCLRMWRNLKCVPRLHLGLKLSSIKFLHSSHREKISRKLNIDAGLIVQEVSAGSTAEKIGIRNGDVIESLNGECFPTVVELEIMMLHTCEQFLEKGGCLDASVDLTVGLFQIRKEKSCTKMLTANVSDDVEVIAGGTYPVSARVENTVDGSGNTPHNR